MYRKCFGVEREIAAVSRSVPGGITHICTSQSIGRRAGGRDQAVPRLRAGAAGGLVSGTGGAQRGRAHVSGGGGGELRLCVCWERRSAHGDLDAQSRIIQGVVAGIGFIGGGAILKSEGGVHGVAAAASIWNIGVVGASVAQNRYLLAARWPC